VLDMCVFLGPERTTPMYDLIFMAAQTREGGRGVGEELRTLKGTMFHLRYKSTVAHRAAFGHCWTAYKSCISVIRFWEWCLSHDWKPC